MKALCAAVFYTHVNKIGTEEACLIRGITQLEDSATDVTRKIYVSSFGHDRLDR